MASRRSGSTKVTSLLRRWRYGPIISLSTDCQQSQYMAYGTKPFLKSTENILATLAAIATRQQPSEAVFTSQVAEWGKDSASTGICILGSQAAASPNLSLNGNFCEGAVCSNRCTHTPHPAYQLQNRLGQSTLIPGNRPPGLLSPEFPESSPF